MNTFRTRRLVSLVVSISFIIISLTSKLYSQCPSGKVTLSFQEDVNEFVTELDNCTEYDGDIFINITVSGPQGGGAGFTPITNLSGLQNIERINGELKILGPHTNYPGQTGQPFTSLSGAFRNLVYVHDLWIEDLPQINTVGLVGFQSLEEVNNLSVIEMDVKELMENGQDILVNESIVLSKNTNLESFGAIVFSESMKEVSIKSNNFPNEAFSKLRSINDVDELVLQTKYLEEIDFDIKVHRKLELEDNKELISIEGLTIAETLYELELWENNILQEGLENLSNLNHVEDRLWVSSAYDFSFLANLITAKDVYLYGNETVTNLDDLTSLESITGELSLNGLSDLSDLSIFSGVDFSGISLHISNTGVRSLEGLTIYPDSIYAIQLSANNELNDISIFQGIEELSVFRCTSNNSMENLKGLDSLKRVTTQITLNTLPKLKDLSNLINLQYAFFLDLANLNFQEIVGLENFVEVGASLNIYSNLNLENLDGLSSLEYFGADDPNRSDFRLWNNPVLNSMECLNNLRGSIGGELGITNNPLLDNCSIDFICSNISYGDARYSVYDNGVDCGGIEKIEDLCGFNYLEVFLDLNGNGTQEINEPNIGVGEVKVGNDVLLYPNNDGRVGFFLLDNPGFIEYIPEEFWEVTTGNTVTDTPDLLSIPDLIKIGVRGTSNFVDVDSHIGFSTMICDREYVVIATVKNEGTQPVDANITFTAPGIYIPEWPYPNDTTNSVIYFELGEVLPGVSISKRVRFTAPSVNNVALNELLNFTYETEITDLSNNTTIDNGEYQTPFLCAYDPNDKQVFPSGVTDDNLTLFDETEFEYLIRFQNTGNYPAQDITVTDTLDPNLDLSTFEFINASHEMSQIKSKGNALEFVFKNIFLPDSVNNEPESHGFIQFKIKRHDNLPEGTRIENTAHIYFDFNPAIVTNTVYNTMVSQIMTSVSERDLEEVGFVITPNPATNRFRLLTDEELFGQSWSIYNSQGQILRNGVIRGNETAIGLANMQGIYFVKVGQGIQKLIVM